MESSAEGGTHVNLELGIGTDRQIVELLPEQTHSLRARVLRDGTASSEVRFDDDDHDDTIHLGVIDRAGEVLAISTWIVRRHPDHPAIPGVQLRGMATDPATRGEGLGDALLRAGLRRVAAGGARLVWARARDTAIDFYLARGFRCHGHGYVDLATGLPHHDVLLDLDHGDVLLDLDR